ncbi:glycosyl hydrolase family 76 [Botrytis cinerea]
MLPTFALSAATALLLSSSMVNAEIELNLDDDTSIKNAAATIAYDMMTYYKGNQSGGIPGVLPGPPPDPPTGYYWWESGAMWGSLIDYWYYTGDSSYNDDAMAGIQWQTGANNDMMPANWSQSMGNDDQGFWGMTAMTAAETKFQDPPSDRPGWLALAQAVFNTQAVRIDNATCGGGLRWQVYPYLTGYNYKNSIANGCFFNIGARLARYTNNETYAQYAEETWNWVTSVGYMDKEYNIYDGAHIEENCTDINKVQFSYNSGVYLLGAATIQTAPTFGKNVSMDFSMLHSKNFFPTGDIAYEIACEAKLSCTTDMYSFKAFLTRWLAGTTKMAPYTYDLIMPYLKASAVAAAKQCSGPSPFAGRTCGLSWSKGTDWDGTSGVGQQMAAMSAIFCGTSVGNSAAGSGSSNSLDSVKPPSTGDRVGAGMVTTVVLVGMTGMFGWMSL